MKSSLKHMLDAPVKVDNIMAWDGIARPFFEAYDIRLNHPKSRWGLFLRYAITSSTAAHAGDKAVLWAVFVDAAGKKQVLSKQYDLQKHEIVHADQFISIANSFISLAETAGSVENDKSSIVWELVFEDPITSTRLFSYNIFKMFSILKMTFVQPCQICFVSGRVFADGKKHEANHWRLHQRHVFGPAFSHNWSTANCIDFKEDSRAYFEASAQQVMLSKNKTLFVPAFCVFMEGQKYSASSFFSILFKNKSKIQSLSWSFSFTDKGFRFEGEIKRRPTLTAGFQYIAPNAAKNYCYLSPVASIEIKVYKKQKGGWQHYKTLSSQNKCFFETVSCCEDKNLSLDTK